MCRTVLLWCYNPVSLKFSISRNQTSTRKVNLIFPFEEHRSETIHKNHLRYLSKNLIQILFTRTTAMIAPYGACFPFLLIIRKQANSLELNKHLYCLYPHIITRLKIISQSNMLASNKRDIFSIMENIFAYKYFPTWSC